VAAGEICGVAKAATVIAVKVFDANGAGSTSDVEEKFHVELPQM